MQQKHSRNAPTYHPKIKSDTCPSILLLGVNCASPGCADDPFPFPCLGTASWGAGPEPGFLNAAAEGASLMGVPTVGVPARGTRVLTVRSRAEPRVGEAGDMVTSGGEGMSGGEAYGLRTLKPRTASAWAGSCGQRGEFVGTLSSTGVCTYSPLHADHPRASEDLTVLTHSSHGLAGVVEADSEAVGDIDVRIRLSRVAKRAEVFRRRAVPVWRVAKDDEVEWLRNRCSGFRCCWCLTL